MIDKYLNVLVNKIDERITQIQETLGDGQATDYSEYRAMVGEIKGLLTARLNTKDLLKTFEESDD
jgi:hypothetical protein